MEQPISRRGWLKGLGRLTQPEGWSAISSQLRAWVEPPRRFWRPPGACDEAIFRARCDGCGACVAACPWGAIRRLDERYGAAAGSVGVLAGGPPCRGCDPAPCQRACPRGALDPADRRPMGTARIDPARCRAQAGLGCQACYDACPRKGRGLFHDGFGPVVDAAECIGCGACLAPCPEQGALTILPRDPVLEQLNTALQRQARADAEAMRR